MSHFLWKSAAAVTLVLASVMTAAVLDSRSITIESAQSKTVTQAPVYNQISWSPGLGKETWTMRQSHHGLNSPEWDTVQIQIQNQTARFRQLDAHGNPMAFRAACFSCHSNGPRFIRPNVDSKDVRLGLWDKTRILVWNLRIKTYGRLKVDPENLAQTGSIVDSDSSAPVPFRYSDAHLNETLDLRSCTKCHNEKWWGRGNLTKQNANSILFMVKTKAMPPPGFALTPEDREGLRRFLFRGPKD